jgi:hypothetical protein
VGQKSRFLIRRFDRADRHLASTSRVIAADE